MLADADKESNIRGRSSDGSGFFTFGCMYINNLLTFSLPILTMSVPYLVNTNNDNIKELSKK